MKATLLFAILALLLSGCMTRQDAVVLNNAMAETLKEYSKPRPRTDVHCTSRTYGNQTYTDCY